MKVSLNRPFVHMVTEVTEHPSIYIQHDITICAVSLMAEAAGHTRSVSTCLGMIAQQAERKDSVTPIPTRAIRRRMYWLSFDK